MLNVFTGLHTGIKPHKRKQTGRSWVAMSGVAQVNGESIGTAWQAVARVFPEGGTSTAMDNQLTVADASAITILVTTSTDYDINNPLVPLTRDRLQDCLAALRKIQATPYARLKAENIRDHRSYFERATLDLGATPPKIAGKTTQERIDLVRKGGTDPDLIEDLFQMGRYLLITSSRPGRLRLSPVVSGCLRLSPVVSGCLRLSPVLFRSVT